MIYILKRIEKKIYYKIQQKHGFSFLFFNFILRSHKKYFLKKYFLEVGLLKKKIAVDD